MFRPALIAPLGNSDRTEGCAQNSDRRSCRTLLFVHSGRVHVLRTPARLKRRAAGMGEPGTVYVQRPGDRRPALSPDGRWIPL